MLCFTTWIFLFWVVVTAMGDPNPRLSAVELNKVLAEKIFLVHTFMILCIVSFIISVVFALMSLKKTRWRAVVSLGINVAFLGLLIYSIIMVSKY